MVSIPVIAAGGIADARGVVAAFALGAEGVQLGTRFVAVEENIAHSKYKQAILNAEDTDTAITCRKLLPTRSLKTEFTRRLLELEESGASAGDIREFLGYSRARTGQIEGDLENGEAYSWCVRRFDQGDPPCSRGGSETCRGISNSYKENYMRISEIDRMTSERAYISGSPGLFASSVSLE